MKSQLQSSLDRTAFNWNRPPNLYNGVSPISDSDGHCGIRERDQVRAGGGHGRQDDQDSRLQLRREGRGGLLLRGRGAAALIQGTQCCGSGSGI